MSSRDPADQALLRFEARRYANRCSNQEAMIERADTLREISRLTYLPIPSSLMEANDAQEAHRRLVVLAEQRAKTVIADQIAAWVKADKDQREKLRLRITDDWNSLTGHLGHLRTWAQRQFTLAQRLD